MIHSSASKQSAFVRGDNHHARRFFVKDQTREKDRSGKTVDSGLSCQAKIQSRSSFLTNTEARVGAYVLEHYSEICECTVTELAERVGTSEATIVRFCKSLGYKGFQEFKIGVARDTIPKPKHLNPDFEIGDSTEIVCRKTFNSLLAALNETLAVLDMQMLERAAEALRPDRRIALFGSGGSNLVALDAQHKFLKVGIQVQVAQDADIQAMTASLLKRGDVAFGISHSGSNQRVVHCMRLARQQGATTIALTTQGKSPLLRYADIVLFSATKETVFKSESVSARMAQLAIIDSLTAAVAFKNYPSSFSAVQKTRKATSSGKF